MSTVARVLSEASGLTAHDVRRIALSAPRRYKVYSIPKRTGGFRVIAQPAREVKLLQRIFVAQFLSEMPVHKCAMAYKANTSILHNAAMHRGAGRPILKMDFQDFFPSLRDSDWAHYCRHNGVALNDEDLELSTRLLFRRVTGVRGLRLAIGAPASPHLSNMLMFEFDKLIYDFALTEQVAYSRYADDLTFSASRTGFLTGIRRKVESIIKELDSPRLVVNNNKTVLATAKYKRTVTGLVLANDGSVTIGRDRKRLIHSAVHRASTGQLDAGQIQELSGLLGFVHAAEPSFLDTLKRKYGSDVVLQIQHAERVPRENRANGQSLFVRPLKKRLT